MSKANEQFTTTRSDLRVRESLIAGSFAHILEQLGISWQDDPNTKGTPERFAKMLCQEVCAGRFEPAPILTVFPNEGHDEIIVVGPINVRSLCAHHFCPILGRAWIGVLPGESLAGLSKFERVVEWFAKRPQMQEALGIQIADYLEEHLNPLALGVVLECSHLCNTWRGVEAHPDMVMTTSVMRGIFREDRGARAEFLSLLKR